MTSKQTTTSNVLTLEQRAVAMLGAAETPSVDIGSMLAEVDTAIEGADADAIKIKELALDPIQMPDPNKARAAKEDSAFAAQRLRTLRTRVQEQLAIRQVEEINTRWRERADDTEAKVSAMVEKLKMYPQMAEAIADLARDVASLEAEVRALNASSPPGEHVDGVELQARGSNRAPSLFSRLVLPRWDNTAEDIWPIKHTLDPMYFAPHAYSQSASPDWWRAGEQARQVHAEAERKDKIAADEARIERNIGW